MTERVSGFVIPRTVTAVAEAAPLQLQIAPTAALPATITTGATQQQHAVALARSAQATFDKNTACFGDSMRSPIRRWGNEHGNTSAKWMCFGLLAGATAAAAGALSGVPLAFEAGRVAFAAVFGTAVVGTTGFALAGLVELGLTKRRVLGSDAVAPMREAYDAAPASSLDRAVIAKVAALSLADLDARQVRGEPPRAALRSIIADGEALADDVKAAGVALIECYLMVHNDRGQLRSEISAYKATKLEHALARAGEPMRRELRTTFMNTLFDGERLRTTATPEVEARLFRVLTGEVEPQAPARMVAPALEGAALANAARELEEKLFDRDGDWARTLSADDAQRLFVLLRSTSNSAAS